MKERAGGKHAVIYWKYTDGGMGKVTLPIQVSPRKFGVQYLKLSASQQAKYVAPEVERERKLIGAALDRVSPERLWEGNFILPVEGRISTAFGLERRVSKHLVYRHRGVDIAAAEGTEVKAAASGVVSLADESFVLHGKTVVVDHGQGVSSLYIHLSAIEVSEGERVARGEVIGRVGATGVATGPHVHFAVYAYHEPLDPLFWVELPMR
jgi:murein DD-endopeptidase MepM/ murein hydrolase activator NlpD